MPGSQFSLEQLVAASKQVGFGLLATLALAGCANQEALTAKATNCNRIELSILPSKYRDQGVTTAWCALCKGERYRCIGNAERTRVECRPLRPDEVC